MISYKGKEYTTYSLSKVLGVPYTTLKRRYDSGARDDELCVSQCKQRVEYKGKQLAHDELGELLAMPSRRMASRIRNGYTEEELSLPVNKKRHGVGKIIKLTKEQALDIFIAATYTQETQTAIAKRFNIDQSHVSDIKLGKRWPHFFNNRDEYHLNHLAKEKTHDHTGNAV